MSKCYCKYCGDTRSSVKSLTTNACANHPNGSNKGKHILYESTEKSEYTCKYCGDTRSSIKSLTTNTCANHPNKGNHVPALYVPQ